MPRNPEWEIKRINAKTCVYCILCQRILWRLSKEDKNIRTISRRRLVLNGILAGKTNPEIAKDLELKITTVKRYVRELFVEYGVDTKRYLGRVRLVFLETRRRRLAQAQKKEKR